LAKDCLNVYFLKRVVEIREKEIVLENEKGKHETFAMDVVFILVGADPELGLLKDLGVKTRQSKYGEVPVYDSNFETTVPGVYVAGHFTEARHIAAAIKVPKKIIPKIAERIHREDAETQRKRNIHKKKKAQKL
jgi:thioredoxin reductase (NADPH)